MIGEESLSLGSITDIVFIIYQSQLRAISVDVKKIEENVNGLLVFVKSFTSTCQYMGIYDFIRQATNSQLLSWSQL